MVLQVGESGQRDVSQDDNGVTGHKQDLCWGTSHEKAGSDGGQNLEQNQDETNISSRLFWHFEAQWN